jgi:hypothetical protein
MMGSKTLGEMKYLPFMRIKWKGEYLPINGDATRQCLDTDGDCFAFVKKYIDIFYKSYKQISKNVK